MSRARPYEPLATLKSLYRLLSKPLRQDPVRDTATFRGSSVRACATRLRNCIAHLEKQEGGQ